MRQRNEIIMYSIFVVLGLVIIALLVFSNKNEVYENDIKQNTEEVEKTEEPTPEVNNESNKEDTTKKDETNTNTNNQTTTTTETSKPNSSSNNNEKPTTNSSSNQTKPTESTTDKNNSSSSSNSSNISSNKDQTTYSAKDIAVINELNTLEKNTDELLASNDKSIGDKAKGIFIDLVDFCFYDGEINGYTFNELTDKGKSQVLKIVNRIDEKIEKKFPNYKDNISSKVSKALNKMSELIKKGANNLNEFALDKLGVEYYNNMIEEKDELVKYTKNALNLFKNFGSSLWNKTTTKLKDWYENFKKENS